MPQRSATLVPLPLTGRKPGANPGHEKVFSVIQVRIGVDELFQTHRRPGRWWCHLLCDDFSPAGLQQLHGFAARMGLHTRAFHDPPGRPRPHYDLTPEMREVALQMGALQLTMRQVVEFLELGRGKITDTAGDGPLV